MTKRKALPDRQEPLDPAVAAILTDQDAKRAARQAPREEGRKMRQQAARAEAERERQEARHRVTLELAPVVIVALQKVAETEGVSPASAANWLLAQALGDYAGGRLTFEGCKKTTSSPRWAYTVDLSAIAGDLEKWAK